MANNTTNIIIHFTESQKLVVIDVRNIMHTAFSTTPGYLVSSLTVNKIGDININMTNVSTPISNSDVERFNFLYNNKFRINGHKLITNNIDKNSNYINMSNHIDIINHTIDTKSTLDGSLNNLGVLYTLSFDTFNDPIDFQLKFTIRVCEYKSVTAISSTEYIINVEVYIDDSRCAQYHFFDNLAKMINSNMESFMLLRTNPKLTGNIKLVVDSSDHLYLDTFKTSAILNKKEYRHQAISDNGDYAYDVYKVFHTVSPSDLYNVYSDSYDPHKNYFDLNSLIENIYEYGAEYNNDKLYSENMHILAPLYLGKHLPDYFMIFKTDRLISYSDNNTNSVEFKLMIKNAQIVKIFDLRKKTTIGKYLYNYHQLIGEYLAGTCSLLFIEQDNERILETVYNENTNTYTKVLNPNYRQGRNTWGGIAYNKGILATKSETSYFATNILNGKAPQENFNMFLLNGFQRNNLLFPNILNLDFMFNDDTAADLSMHNYFGLYVTENEFITFNQIIEDKYKNNNKIYYFDHNNNEINLYDTPVDVITSNKYSDRIFGMSTNDTISYINSMSDINQFIKRYVVNQPDKNLISLEGQLVKNSDTEMSFVSIELINQMLVGEHFKFIALNADENGNKEHIVLDIIASDDSRLLGCDDYIFPYIVTNEAELENGQSRLTKLYRLSFYANDIYDNSQLASLDNQIIRICSAINKFNSFIKVSSYDSDTIAFISSYENTYLQHIVSNVVDDSIDSIENTTIRPFNYNNVINCYVTTNILNTYRESDVPFANYGLELNGPRYTSIIKFIDFSEYDTNYMYEIYKDVYAELKSVPYPIISTTNGYFPIIKHHINACSISVDVKNKKTNLNNVETLFNSVLSPWDVNCSIIVSKYEIVDNNNTINICTPAKSHICLMGINQIKDIDTYTNITETTEYKTALYALFTAGERVPLDNSDQRLHLFTTYKLINGGFNGIPVSANTVFMITTNSIIYTNDIASDGYKTLKLSANYIEFITDTLIELSDIDSLEIYLYSVSKPVMDVSNYYVGSDTTTSNLKIPVVPMINCQWKSNGVYFDNNSVLDVNTLIDHYDIQGNFIENRYTPAGNQNNQYIINKLNDLIDFPSESINTIKDLILSNAYPGFIKKYLIANYKIDTAIAHYNGNTQTLNFIYYGLSFNLKLSNILYKNDIKLNEYNNYEIFIINNYDGSLTNEMYINTNDNFILLINHIYCINDLYSSSSIKLFNINGEIQNAKYAWFNGIYTYKLSNFAILNNTAYFYKDSNKQLTSTNTKYLIELDLITNEYEALNTSDAKSVYSYITIDASNPKFKSESGYDCLVNDPTISAQYPLITEDITEKSSLIHQYNSNITNLINIYGYKQNDKRQKEIDYRQHNMLMVKYPSDLTSCYLANYDNDIKLDLYINTFMYGDLNIYIMTNTSEQHKKILVNKEYKPLNIMVSRPNKIKFNLGMFNPNFVDIFDFEIEDEIQNDINLDTLYGNTKIKSIKSISNYYQTKIMDQSAKCVYNYFADPARSPLSTSWDKNIYRLYSDDDTYSYIPGYQTGIQDKMFFGSSCLNLKNDSIILKSWNYDATSNYSDYDLNENNIDTNSTQSFVIKLNLTKTFYDYIMTTNFVNNWNTNKIINNKTYINNYINNTLIKLYNFRSGFDVILYKRYIPNKATTFVKSRPADFAKYNIEKNVKTSFEEINNEVILTISISNYDNYYFYPVVKIFKY